jgi:hypothetical protein
VTVRAVSQFAAPTPVASDDKQHLRHLLLRLHAVCVLQVYARWDTSCTRQEVTLYAAFARMLDGVCHVCFITRLLHNTQ